MAMAVVVLTAFMPTTMNLAICVTMVPREPKDRGNLGHWGAFVPQVARMEVGRQGPAWVLEGQDRGWWVRREGHGLGAGKGEGEGPTNLDLLNTKRKPWWSVANTKC